MFVKEDGKRKVMITWISGKEGCLSAPMYVFASVCACETVCLCVCIYKWAFLSVYIGTKYVFAFMNVQMSVSACAYIAFVW